MLKLRKYFIVFVLLLCFNGYGQTFELVSPLNDQTIPDTTISFSWNKVTNVVDYHLEISTDDLFTSVIVSQTGILTENYNASGLNFDQSYFWRVTASMPSGPDSISNVREFKVFNPSNVPDIMYWLTADSVSLSGSNVTDWHDISGNGYVLSQTTTNNQPIQVSDAINGYPIIRFDGTNDYMSFTSDIAFDSLSYILVFKKNLTSNTGMILGADNSSHCIANYYDSHTYVVGDGGYGSAPTGHIMDYTIFEAICDGGTCSFYQNKTLVGSPSGFSYQMTFNNIGQRSSSEYLFGDIAEVVIFDYDIDTESRENIENYLHDKYAPGVNLGIDISVDYGFCDTMLVAGERFVDYLWSTGDNTDTIYASQTGYYSVTVTDIFGFTSVDSVYVSFANNIFHNDTTICLFDTLTWDTGLDHEGYDFTWSDLTTDSLLVTPDPGDYYVEITDTNGCVFTSETFTLKLDSFPQLASLGPDMSYCAGNQITLIEGEAETFLWFDGSTDEYHVVDTSGAYWLTVTDSLGCTKTDTINITIVGLAPLPNFSHNTTCIGQSTQFNNNSTTTDGSTIISYNWLFGDSNSSTLPDPENLYADTGYYDVTLEIETDAGCSNDTLITIYILPKPGADFSYNSIGCINVGQNFYDQTSLNGTESIIDWDWYFGDTGASSLQDPSHTYSGSGSYDVMLTVQSNNLCYDSIVYQIDIFDAFLDPENFELISPVEEFITIEDDFEFVWDSSINAAYYKFELSDDSDFDNILVDHQTSNLSYISPLTVYGELYWRITAFNYCNDSIYSDSRIINHLLPDTAKGLDLWLIAEGETDSSIDVWEDISMNHFDVTQIVADSRPLVIENAIDTFSVLRFDGTNDFFDFPSELLYDTLSFFAVFKKNLAGSAGMLIGQDATQQCITNHYDGYTYVVGDDSYVGFDNGEILEYTIFSVIIDNDSIYLYLNKSQYSSGLLYDFEMTFNKIGQRFSSEFLNGDIAEIILFDNQLNASDRSEIEDYLHYKYAPPVNLGRDIYVEYGFADTTLDAHHRYVDYSWDSGETSQSISVNESGIYSVTVTDIFGFTSTDEVRVFYPEPDNPQENMFCLGDTMYWNSGLNNDYDFTWSDSSTDTLLQITEEGGYHLIVTDSLGFQFFTDTFDISVDSFPVTASLGPDLSLCSGNTITLTTGEAETFLWSDGSTGEYYTVDAVEEIWVVATDSLGCIMSDTIQILSIIGFAPIAGFESTTTCLGQETTFTDTSYTTDGSTIISYSWDFGDTGISTDQNPVNNFADTGSYTVIVDIETDAGCSNSFSSVIYVHPLPELAFNPIQACINDSVGFVNLSVIPVDEIDSYSWDFGDGNYSGESNPDHLYDDPDIYEVILVATSNYGCVDTLTQSIDVKPAPQANFSYGAGCVETPLTFTDATVVSGIFEIIYWKWTVDGDDYEESSPTIIPSVADTFDVSLFVQSVNGCDDQITQEVIIHDVPQANFGNLYACQNENHIIVDSSTFTDGNIEEWNWIIDDYGLFTDSNPQFYVTDTGDFEVRLIIIDENFCKDTLIDFLRVDEKPEANFSFDPWYGMPGSPIEFTNLSTNQIYHNWDFDDGESSSELNPTHVFLDSGNYEVVLIGENEYGCFDTITKSITVIMPLYDVAVLSLTDEIIDNKLYVSATIANFGSVPLYSLDLKLDFDNGSSITETWTGEFLMGGVMIYTFNAAYEVSAFTMPSYVCVDAQLEDGLTDVDPENNIKCNTEEGSYMLLEPYPNPTTDQILIEFVLPYSDVVIIDIYDSSGKQIDRAVISETSAGLNRLIYDTSVLAKGVYNISFNFEGSFKTERFIKE